MEMSNSNSPNRKAAVSNTPSNPKIGNPEINQRDRVGSLIQLYSVGHQDIFLTMNPEITWFQRDYKTHMGFGMHHLNLTRDSSSNKFLGSREIFSIPRQGTYLSNLTIFIVLNDPKIGNELFQANNQFGVLELISEISFRVGNDVLDVVTPELILAELSLFQGQDRWGKMSRVLRGTMTSRGIECMIPLPFWFCHWKPGFDNGSKFPLYPLDKNAPIEVHVVWKTKSEAKCICSDDITRTMECWVDYITCSSTEIRYLQTNPQESLIANHETSVTKIENKEQRVQIPFRKLCKQLVWGFKQDVNLIEYIQTMAETEFDVRKRLSEFVRTVEDIVQVHESHMVESSRLWFQKNLLCNIQQKGFLLHHFTGNVTLHDYIDPKFSRLFVVHHEDFETKIHLDHFLHQKGDYLEDSWFQNPPTEYNSLFVQSYGPSLGGLVCDHRHYGTKIYKGQEDIVVSFRFFCFIPDHVWNYMSEDYIHPLCSLSQSDSYANSLEIGIHKTRQVRVRLRGRVYDTPLDIDTMYTWNTIEVQVQQTFVHVILNEVLCTIPIHVPMYVHYWWRIGNHSWNSMRNEEQRFQKRFHESSLYPPIVLPKEYVSEMYFTDPILYITKHFMVTCNDVWASRLGQEEKREKVYPFIPPLSSTEHVVGFEDSLGRFFLFYQRRLLCIDTQGNVLYYSQDFSTELVDATAYDPSSRCLLCKMGANLLMLDIDTMVIEESSSVISYHLASRIKTDVAIYQSKPIFLERDASYVHIHLENESFHYEIHSVLPPQEEENLYEPVLLSHVFEHTLYICTEQELVKIESLNIAEKQYIRCNVPNLHPLLRNVFDMHVEKGYVYLYVNILSKINPLGTDETLEDTIGIIRIISNTMTLDSSFANQGIQPLFSGIYESRSPFFEYAQVQVPVPSLNATIAFFGYKMVRCNAHTVSVHDLLFPSTPIATILFPRPLVNLTVYEDSFFTNDFVLTGIAKEMVIEWYPGDSFRFDFLIYDRQHISIDSSGLRVNGIPHTTHEDLPFFHEMLLAHPLANSCFAMIYKTLENHVYLAFRQLGPMGEDGRFVLRNEQGNEMLSAQRAPFWEDVQEWGNMTYTVLRNRVLYEDSSHPVRTFSFLIPPLYPPSDFYKTAHLSFYLRGHVPCIVDASNVVVLTPNSFVWNHTDVIRVSDVFGGSHDQILFRWFGNQGVYIFFFEGYVQISWISLLPAQEESGTAPQVIVNVSHAIPRSWTTVPQSRIQFHNAEELDIYIYGIRYQCSKSQGVVQDTTNSHYVYYRHGSFVLCKFSESIGDLVLRDIQGKFADLRFSFDMGLVTNDSYFYVDLENRKIYKYIFGFVRHYHIKTPIPLQSNRWCYSFKDHTLWNIVGFAPEASQWTVISLPSPSLTPIPSDELSNFVWNTLEQERFYRRYRSYVWNDLMISTQPMGRRQRVPSLWKSTCRIWIFEVFSLGAALNLETLLGSESVLSFYDPFGTNLQPLIVDVDLSGNRLYVEFQKEVQIHNVTTTRNLSNPIDMLIYIKHIEHENEIYYYALSTSTLQVLDSGIIRHRFGIEQIRSSNYPTSYQQVVIDLANLKDLKLPVYNSFAFSRVPMRYQLRLGEAELPAKPKESTYFCTVVPFFTFQAECSLGFHCYSFSVYPGYYQPSGHYNMSVTNNSLVIQMDQGIAGSVYIFGFSYNMIQHKEEAKLVFR